MTEKDAVDEIALTNDPSPSPSGASDHKHPTAFTPEHAPRRRVEYERRVDADGWVDPAAERTGQPPATDAVSMRDAPAGDSDA